MHRSHGVTRASCNISATSASCVPSATHSIIPDRVLAFPSLLFTYLLTATVHETDVTHVFDLLSSDPGSISLYSPLSLCHHVFLRLSGFTNIAYITNQTSLYK